LSTFDHVPARIRLGGLFALEREMLRVDPSGALALTNHPEGLGDKATHPYITTDFAESQVELITPPFAKVEQAHDFLDALYDIVANELTDELLWPQSMPCRLPADGMIPLADFGDAGLAATDYRRHLLEKYGAKKQLISGIHFNFSFPDRFIETLHAGSPERIEQFKSNLYLKLTRNFLRHRWLIVYLLGSTPLVHSTYEQRCVSQMQALSSDAFSNEVALSYRNSDCGYTNAEPFFPDYSSLSHYIDSVQAFIDDGLIAQPSELYSPIRIKTSSGRNDLSTLADNGIDYIEIRNIDLNPFEKTGIAIDDLRFLHLFLLYMAMKEEVDAEDWQREAFLNQQLVAKHGLKPDLKLFSSGKEVAFKEMREDLFDQLTAFSERHELGFEDVLSSVRSRLLDTGDTYASLAKDAVRKSGFIDWSLDLARSYRREAFEKRFSLKGYTDMELSTQIVMRSAMKQGLRTEVIDRDDQFIRIHDGRRTEYLKQATKTSRDSYISVLMMENKTVTKQVLAEAGIRVPTGVELRNEDELSASHADYSSGVVLKPKSTNFGLGVTIFPGQATFEDALTAFRFARTFDDTVLREKFLKGKEYRFLAIDDAVEGVLLRVPANVEGDGHATVEELVSRKNEDPLRGKGYKTPLEKIEIDEVVRHFLDQQGMSEKSVPPAGDVVFLRENSNISTGGDSIDYTDSVPDYYKQVAIKAAKAVGANVCGVDMMIPDLTSEEEYGIIELNFNPAIHIHCFPHIGRERDIGRKVLELVFGKRT